MRDSNIINLFLVAAERQPDNIAFIHEKKTISYRQLFDEIKHTAAYYNKRGIKQGDKVLVFVPMRVDLYRIVLSLFYLGACPVFIDEWVSVDRLNQCCKVVKCDAMVADTKFLLLSYFIGELRRIKIKLSSRKRKVHAADLETTVVKYEDTALITFTTGSTGVPKAADRTHAFLRAQYDALTPYLNDAFNPALVTLPIVVLINLGLGKTTVLPPVGFAVKKPETVSILKNALKIHGVETIITSPSILHNCVSGDGKIGNLQVKKIITGGGPVLPGLAAKVTEYFPQAERLAVYGSTEAEPISHISFDTLLATTPENILSLGLPVGQTDSAIKIAIIPYIDAPIPEQTTSSWRQKQLNAGAVGEIVVAGPHVLKAYVNNEEARARNKVVVNGEVWHRTGDAGRLDESGKLYLFGLCKEIIHWKDSTYYPLLLSQAIKTYTAVQQAALLLLNDRLTLVLESRQPIEARVLTGALEKVGLTDIGIHYIEKIPTDPRHQTKIDYEQLRALLRK